MKQLPTNDQEKLEAMVSALLSNVRVIVRALDETDDMQWRAPRTPAPLQIGYSDPTGETVIDYQRLSLRAARRLAVIELGKTVKALDNVIARLERAAAPYDEGDTYETR